MARRSARLSSRNSSTPQPVRRVSLSHDAFGAAPRTVPAKLSSLQESDEMPGSFPDSPSDSILNQPSKRQRTLLDTPKRSSPIVPTKEEMHPQATYQSTAKAHEEARWLGFSAMSSHAEAESKSASTPSKINANEKITTPSFKFTFQREHSLELSPSAKRLMYEKRAEAALIKEQMKSSGEALDSLAEASRKIMTPKSQRSRFSDVHNAQFEKMNSIAGHASAFRKDPLKSQSSASPGNTLRRSPSKASLVHTALTPTKLPQAPMASGVKRKADVQLTKTGASNEDSAARKRVKHVEIMLPSTQAVVTSAVVPQSSSTSLDSKLAHLTTPTKASLARASSVKSTTVSKIPAPAVQTPSKPAIVKHNTPLLKRSPLKHTTTSAGDHAAGTKQSESPLLNRTPVRAGISGVDSGTQPTQVKRPLLAQSPARAAADKNPFEAATPQYGSTSSKLFERFKLLRASPIKSILRTPQRLYSDDPAKVAAGTHLATPPQITSRLGRQVPATAPVNKRVDFSSSTKAREASKEASLSPAPLASKRIANSSTSDAVIYPTLDDHVPAESLSVQKRRQSSGPHDFTFRAGSEIVFAPSTTPTKSTIPRRGTSAYTIRHVAPEPDIAEAMIENPVNDSKQRKMRFENALSVAQTNLSPTVTLGSKKRKFDYENEIAENDASALPGKENLPFDNIDRPVKRLKAAASPKAAIAPVRKVSANESKKRSTLGVKPKSAVGKPVEVNQKRPGGSISMARLNALAQPKKRG